MRIVLPPQLKRRQRKVVRLLELGLVLDWRDSFPGFGEAFEAADITWNVDPDPWWHKASEEVEKGVPYPA